MIAGDSAPERGAHVEAWLDRHRTGELSPEASAVVEEHLRACPACAAELEDLRAFSDRVGEGFAAAAAGAERSEAEWTARRAATVERVRRTASGRRLGVGLAPQAALVALAIVAVGVVWRAGLRGPEDAGRRLSPTALEAPGAPPADAPAAPEQEAVRGGDEPARLERLADGRVELEEERAAELDAREDAGRSRAGPNASDASERIGAVAVAPEPGGRAPGAAAGEGQAAPATPRETPEPDPRFATPPAAEAERERRAELADRAQAEGASDTAAKSRAAPPAAAAPEPFLHQGRQRDPVADERAGGVDALASAATDSTFLRFERQARLALEGDDRALGLHAWALWRDTLAPLVELEPRDRARGEALADSLERAFRR